MSIKNNNRNGVTLLIVLAMMVMFAMLVTTFMVIVSHNRRTADFYAKIRIDPPTTAAGVSLIGSAVAIHQDIETAFQILMVGSSPSSPPNVIGGHSILENLYGHPPGNGLAGNNFQVTPAGANLLQIEINSLLYYLRNNLLGNVVTVYFDDAEYLDDDDDDWQLHNKSTFVFDVDPQSGHVFIVPFTGMSLPEQATRLNRPECRLIFNVPQFSTTGYTAPDPNTRFLAWNDVTEVIELDGTKINRLNSVLPSFHRGTSGVLRRSPTPNFTGSNPAATAANWGNFLTNGPWDVDGSGNGIAEGVWLDVGLSPRQDSTGQWHKPLVAYHVIDMDGRINVNTWQNLTQFDTPDSNIDVTPYQGVNGSLNVQGTGIGSAEFSSDLIMRQLLDGNGVFAGRYGSDGVPGGQGNDLLLNNGINLAAYTQGGLLADWFGFSPILFDELGNRVVAVPQDSTGNPYDIPYLLNPYDESSGDEPFDSEDWESLVRSVIDADYHELPRRFRGLLGGFDPTAFDTTMRRYNLAARSSNIPAAPPLYASLTANENTLWMLLPIETRRGEKVNLNRLTLRPDWMTGGNALLVEKARFAQEIFYLLRVIRPAQNEEELERYAQWSVNLVDFIDPDDVMTPFIFNKNVPEDCIYLINTLLDNPSSFDLTDDYMLIWGFEKPEVVITETLAFHNRRVTLTPTMTPGEYVPNQEERPQGSLFVKLYRQGNPQRNYQTSSLVEAGGNLNLAKQTGSGDYFWRLAIGEAAKTEAGKFKWKDDDDADKNALRQLLTPDAGKVFYPQFYQWSSGNSLAQYRPDLEVPERFIWFGQNVPTHASIPASEMQQRSFVNATVGNVVLTPDSSLVIAPWNTIPFEAGVSFDLPGNLMVAKTITNPAVVLNASEPLDNYQSKGSPGPDKPPFDDGTNTIFPQRGTIPCYKTICLQRLADPNRPHHPIANPYITVDWSMIDLHVFNSEDTIDEDNPSGKEGLDHSEAPLFSSRQWMHETASGFVNIWDRTLDDADLTGDTAGLPKDGTASEPSHTLDETGFFAPLLHFPWHDAPLMNTGELMLVPSSAPGRFGVEFHDRGAGEDFFGDSPRFSYNDIGSYFDWSDSEMLRLFNFVHVPSRFAGTRWKDTPLVYREPGKINPNTVTEETWKALANGRNFPDYEDIKNKRPWSNDDWTKFRLEELIDSTASNPYTVLENAMRLSDVTTTQSNVFAIWITVGYFNVDDAGGNNLGAERGLDDASVRRYRAFYLIDRSIPVGFRRGEELNFKDVIIKKTLLELK